MQHHMEIIQSIDIIKIFKEFSNTFHLLCQTCSCLFKFLIKMFWKEIAVFQDEI